MNKQLIQDFKHIDVDILSELLARGLWPLYSIIWEMTAKSLVSICINKTKMGENWGKSFLLKRKCKQQTHLYLSTHRWFKKQYWKVEPYLTI